MLAVRVLPSFDISKARHRFLSRPCKAEPRRLVALVVQVAMEELAVEEAAVEVVALMVPHRSVVEAGRGSRYRCRCSTYCKYRPSRCCSHFL